MSAMANLDELFNNLFGMHHGGVNIGGNAFGGLGGPQIHIFRNGAPMNIHPNFQNHHQLLKILQSIWNKCLVEPVFL